MKLESSKKKDAVQRFVGKTASAVLDISSQNVSLQRKADLTNNAMQRAVAPRQNNTGMPDNLKSGIERLSGFSMDDVRVHYNSSKPATVQALAYTQGTDIHVAPGQEKYLPHEAWHVAQQMAGRVSPTTNINGMPVNDNAALEHEADVMGEKAVKQRMENVASVSQFKNSTEPNFVNVMQRVEEPSGYPNTYFDVSRIPLLRRSRLRPKLKKIIDVMFGHQWLDKTVDKIVVVVVPFDVAMTDLDEFKDMASKKTSVGGNRSWNYVRGNGGNKKDGVVYVGVTEENLMGTDTTVPNAENYEKGYSTTTHEIAHSIHLYRMEGFEKKQITNLYNEKLDKMANDENAWPDGRCLNREDFVRLRYMARTPASAIAKNVGNISPELKDKMCYASQHEQEYYAQSVNAFLGTNAGNDPYTGLARHNGKDWLKTNDRGMYNLLERRYGENAVVENANPRRNP